MNKDVYEKVRDRSDGLCEYPIDGGVCGCNVMCQEHHVYGGNRNRKHMEKTETVIMLCDYHHNNPKFGAHHNKSTRQVLRDWAIKNLLAIGWTKEKIINETGKWDGE